jgi:hypothetical protein
MWVQRIMVTSRLVQVLLIVALATETLVMAQPLLELHPVCKAPIPLSVEQKNGTVKTEYTVGVLAIRTIEDAFAQYNKTISAYLTQAVGSKFDPPISFRMVAKGLKDSPLDYFASSEVDFIVTQGNVFTCINNEVGATSLATQINAAKINGTSHALTQFAGVIFVKDDERTTDIQTIKDIQGKRVAVGSIIGLGRSVNIELVGGHIR